MDDPGEIPLESQIKRGSDGSVVRGCSCIPEAALFQVEKAGDLQLWALFSGLQSGKTPYRLLKGVQNKAKEPHRRLHQRYEQSSPLFLTPKRLLT